MVHSHCTRPGTGMGTGLRLGPGMMGLYITLCTRHTTLTGTGTGTGNEKGYQWVAFRFPGAYSVNEPYATCTVGNLLMSGASLRQMKIPNLEYNCGILFLCQMFW